VDDGASVVPNPGVCRKIPTYQRKQKLP
jgi:hypothetical protein